MSVVYLSFLFIRLAWLFHFLFNGQMLNCHSLNEFAYTDTSVQNEWQTKEMKYGLRKKDRRRKEEKKTRSTSSSSLSQVFESSSVSCNMSYGQQIHIRHTMEWFIFDFILYFIIEFELIYTANVTLIDLFTPSVICWQLWTASDSLEINLIACACLRRSRYHPITSHCSKNDCPFVHSNWTYKLCRRNITLTFITIR